MKCLLIDDNPIDLLVQEKILTYCDAGLEIIKQQSGEDALQWLGSAPELPGLILVDINMPCMSGFEFLEEYKRRWAPGKSGVKIYVVSSSLDPSDIGRAEDDNVVAGYLTKPLSLEEIKAQLGFLVEQK